jgi:hypothetical protein
VVEDRIDGWWNQRSTVGFTMRALVGQNKRFLVSKKKNRDRTKRSRQSNAEVSLDNADAVIEGAPSLTLFKGGVLGSTFYAQKVICSLRRRNET